MRLFYENILIIKMKFIKKNGKYIGIVIMCVFCSYLTTLATNYIFDSGDVRFDNTGTSLESVNVQDAIDETFHHVTDYNDIKTTIGTGSLTTTNKTLIGAINEVNGNLGLPSSASGVTGADAFSKINTLNSKIETYYMGEFSSQSALESALLTYVSKMDNNQFKNVKVGTSPAFGFFRNTNYMGTIVKFSSSRFHVIFFRGQVAEGDIVGSYDNGTWQWEQFATKSDIDTLNNKLTRTSDNITDNNYGINVHHTYNGGAHMLLLSGTAATNLSGSTKYEIASSSTLTNFVSYTPAYNYDSDNWAYIYISNGKLCVQFRKSIPSGTAIRYIINWT